MTENNNRKIEQIYDFCFCIDKLIYLVEHPNKSQAVTKANADRYGDRLNELARKIWPQINFNNIGWLYQPNDIPDNMTLFESIFAATPEHKKNIVERWQQWKDRSLEYESRLQKYHKQAYKKETEKMRREAEAGVILRYEPNIKIYDLAERLGVSPSTVSRLTIWRQSRKRPL